MASIGVCSLCLEKRKLTFEHVPPKRVFNHLPAVAHTLHGLHLGSQHKKSPPLLQGAGGVGRRTLCETCNGQTAAWYGNAFADWTAQCLRFASRIQTSTELLLPFDIQPLNVLKQILTMAIAVAGSKTPSPPIDELRRFVLNPQRMRLPSHAVVRAYFNPVDGARRAPLLTQNRLSASCAVLDIRSGTSVFVIAEVAFPPMGYVLYLQPPAERVSVDFTSLCDIRSFGDAHYRQRRTFFLSMPIRHPFGPVPGHYPNLRASGTQQMLDDNHVVITSKDLETLPKTT